MCREMRGVKLYFIDLVVYYHRKVIRKGASIEKQVQKLHNIRTTEMSCKCIMLIILNGYRYGTPSAFIWSD